MNMVDSEGVHNQEIDQTASCMGIGVWEWD